MLLILGCGRLGQLVAARWGGGPVVGVRRSASAASGAGEPAPQPAQLILRTGDIADAACWSALPGEIAECGLAWPPPQVLLAASPGLRRGRDHGLAAAAELIRRHLPRARLVYTGTTAVYADAQGAAVDEQGAVAAHDPAVAGLLAIEAAVTAQADALVLRLPALVGPARTQALERLRAGGLTVRGSLDRPFPFIHEVDAAELCVQALAGAFGRGLLNAASPQPLSLRAHYCQLAQAAGVPEPLGDGAAVPSRSIDAGRLWSMLPGRVWRAPCDP
jgi:nucleoside-diphosphate-sugar epimerase